MEKENSREESVNFIKNSIASIPDWPKKGIIFRDITTLLQNPKAFEKSIKILEQRYKEKEIDVIAGIESRGFIIGSALAQKLGKPLVLIRKPGKLPRETIKETYDLEYGTDSIEIHKDAVMPNEKVLLVDDLLATGGTAVAACNLIRKLHGDVIEACFIIELPDLNGRDKLPVESFSIVSFEGE
ncbi:MAG: adenine phosphoribosyltransferase [Candidatus Pacearchaeota archaeon]